MKLLPEIRLGFRDEFLNPQKWTSGPNKRLERDVEPAAGSTRFTGQPVGTQACLGPPVSRSPVGRTKEGSTMRMWNLFKPNVRKLRARGDVGRLVQALAYRHDSSIQIGRAHV